jgi:starvation-inducible DNA-binding protein
MHSLHLMTHNFHCPLVEAANDQPTADVLIQRLEVHEETAWMLRSLLED